MCASPGKGIAMAIARPAAASHFVLYFPCRISPALHFAVLAVPVVTGANRLRIRCDILLQIQIIQQIEIRVHVVIIVQSLQIAYRGARRRCD